MNEYDGSETPEHQIGAAWQHPIVKLVTQPGLVEK